MFRLQVKTHFDAAHYLLGYQGKCANLHGHRWDVELVVEGKQLNAGNMLVDFSKIKKELNGYLDHQFDHKCLNESLNESNPTAEWIAKKVFETMDPIVEKISEKKTHLCRVTVWESPDCCVKYSPDMMATGQTRAILGAEDAKKILENGVCIVSGTIINPDDDARM
jgi:6-pyruvoyltetrahydropterin/6-carboxytetrahydropterin synthase